MLFDTHAHLSFDSLSHTIPEILTRMQEHRVMRSIQIGCDIESSICAIELAREYPDFFRATVGIHPSECLLLNREEICEKMETLILENRDVIVGIGEVGLDYHRITSTWEEHTNMLAVENAAMPETPSIADIQKSWFHVQSELAKKYALPLIIHTRDARDDTLACIREYGITHAVMHCYSEDVTFAEALLDHSSEIYFSFSWIVTYKKSEMIQETVKMLPLDRILIETDSPFLAPQPVRWSVNDSANVRYVYEKICELRNESPDIIERSLWENACRFYAWAE